MHGQVLSGRRRWCVVGGNALALLERIPSESVDCVVTSPPFNIGLNRMTGSGLQSGASWVAKSRGGYQDTLSEATYRRQQKQLFRELYRVLKPTGSLFYNHQLRWKDGECLHPFELVQQSPFELRTEVVWDRPGSVIQNARMFPRNDQRIYWLIKSRRYKWKQEANRWHTVWKLNAARIPWHSAPFPEEIARRCIIATTDPGDVVLDPYSGSGTTVLAATRAGRRAIGLERMPRYVAQSRRRIRLALAAAAREQRASGAA